MPEGKKSLAIAVRLQPKDKTLTDAEIEAVAGKIVAAAVKLGLRPCATGDFAPIYAISRQ